MKNRLLAAATLAIGSGCGTFTEAEFGGESGAATSTATAADNGGDTADGSASADGGSESGSAEAGSSGGVDGTQGTGGDATGSDATGSDATGSDATSGEGTGASGTGESTGTAAESSSDGAASTGGQPEDWDACFALPDMTTCELASQCEWSNSECEPAVDQETYCESFDTEVSCAASLWECTWEKGECDDPG